MITHIPSFTIQWNAWKWPFLSAYGYMDGIENEKKNSRIKRNEIELVYYSLIQCKRFSFIFHSPIRYAEYSKIKKE